MDYVLHAERFKLLDMELSYLASHGVRVGILNDTDKNEDGDVILFYAIDNEYGKGRIPARPFFRTGIKNGDKKIRERLNTNINKVINGKMTGEQALNNLGIMVKGMIQDSLRNGNWKPNAPRTLALKGNKPPLVDSGSMMDAIDYEIVER